MGGCGWWSGRFNCCCVSALCCVDDVLLFNVVSDVFLLLFCCWWFVFLLLLLFLGLPTNHTITHHRSNCSPPPPLFPCSGGNGAWVDSACAVSPTGSVAGIAYATGGTSEALVWGSGGLWYSGDGGLSCVSLAILRDRSGVVTTEVWIRQSTEGGGGVRGWTRLGLLSCLLLAVSLAVACLRFTFWLDSWIDSTTAVVVVAALLACWLPSCLGWSTVSSFHSILQRVTSNRRRKVSRWQRWRWQSAAGSWWRRRMARCSKGCSGSVAWQRSLVRPVNGNNRESVWIVLVGLVGADEVFYLLFLVRCSFCARMMIAPLCGCCSISTHRLYSKQSPPNHPPHTLNHHPITSQSPPNHLPITSQSPPNHPPHTLNHLPITSQSPTVGLLPSDLGSSAVGLIHGGTRILAKHLCGAARCPFTACVAHLGSGAGQIMSHGV